MKALKILGFGILNFVGRFVVGGILFMGLKMDPQGFLFGAILTITAFVLAYVLLRYVMHPSSLSEAVTIAIVWMLIAAVLDAITAQPVMGVSIGYLFSEIQTWTRLLAILAAAPFVTPRLQQTPLNV